MKKLLVSFVFVCVMGLFAGVREASAQIEYGCYFEWGGYTSSACSETVADEDDSGSGYAYTWYNYQAIGGQISYEYSSVWYIEIHFVSSYSSIAAEAIVWHPEYGYITVGEAYIYFDHTGILDTWWWWDFGYCTWYGVCGAFGPSLA